MYYPRFLKVLKHMIDIQLINKNSNIEIYNYVL